MKKSYLSYAVAFLFALSLQACSLVDVTDITPPFKLSEENVITDIPSANKVLTGTYAQLHSFSLIVDQPGVTGCMGLSFDVSTSGGSSYQQFADNDVKPDNSVIGGIYTSWYYIINMSSHIIEKTSVLTTNDPRKNEIIAEASFLRALGHFSLLRLYGQFFDTSSPYGIVTWNAPAKDVVAKPRSTVSDSYAQIEQDLKIAVANAPQYSTAKFASRQAANMLLAKVYLYKKDYVQAAQYAAATIDQRGNAKLEDKFADVFSKWFNSKEALLAPPFDDKNERNNKAFAFRSYVLPKMSYFNSLAGDPRQTVVVTFTTTTPVATRNGKFSNTTINGQALTANTEYYLRLSEAYLILAEALIRTGNPADLAKGRDMINVIRARAGATLILPAVQTKAELLQIVLKEKLMELGCESGEEWYDLVRFMVEGDLNIASYKPNVTTKTKYIIPIPIATIKAANGVVKQNPGYE
ncbi:RagB/SusD family nutrient uptake outer membrane protein [Pedobacter sp. MC2016-24]|uniref:RagB/SusD family nutrient uptake outer membrane protein n=1 Tax=Pedobacter sp. MC2016-24 TaxID=2780090 RepID=UPI001880F8D2|nr:RagB/SusD family nutrient uptake outer membrane protein [Pedobacter sp. MC2016-24]MBE9601800.1 RagB/SusD family nutrient uptake outer membrane protein [Pedobacter sp. MC2016-24]